MSLPRAEQNRSQRPEQTDLAASIYQAMDLARALVANAAGVPQNKVRIRITRPD